MRPQTFENAKESKRLESIFGGRNGLQNTVFALLDPNGENLSRGSRSPQMAFGGVERFLIELEETSAAYAKKAKPIEALPVVRDLRLVLNVAAADLRPVVVVRGDGREAADALARTTAKVAWSKDAVGRFHYVVLDEETTYEGLTPALGVTVIQPDAYGRGGEALSTAGVDASPRALTRTLREGLRAHDAADKDYETHVRSGLREGIHWESETPSTDRHRRRSDGEERDDPRRRRRNR